MTRNIHNKLSETVPAYKSWHQGKSTTIIHLCLLIIFGTIFASDIVNTVNDMTNDGQLAAAQQAALVRLLNERPDKAGGFQVGNSDQIIVKFKSNVGQTKKAQIIADKGLTLKSKNTKFGFEVYKIDPEYTAEETVQNLKRDYKGEIAEVSVDELAAPSIVPNDPYFSSQWDKTVVNLPTAWNTTTGSASVIVAVADTGVNCNHEDLAANCVTGWNVYNNNSDTSDYYINGSSIGHGTPVAGVIGAIGNNAKGIAGTNWSTKIMPIRATVDDPNSQYYGFMYSSDAIEAINYAADHGAKVINLSFGFGSLPPSFLAAAQYMWNKGGVVVMAEGNSGVDTGQPASPWLIMVGGTDSSNNRYYWSSYGNNIDITAPGCATVTSSSGGYRNFCGTSNSSPEVAGLIGLMYSANPSATPQNIVDDLFATALDQGAAGWDPYYGWGVIQADKAIALISGGNQVPPTPTVSLSANPSSITSGQSSTLSWSSTNSASCSASGAWGGTKTTSGSQSVNPTQTSTYTLTCTGNGGSASQSTTVTVTQPSAPTVSLSANPTTIYTGDSSTLSWTSTNATSCSASDGWSGSKSTSGSQTVSPTQTSVYTLSCTGSGGTTNQSTTVTVQGLPQDTQAPSTPSGLSVNTVTDSQIVISWNPSSDNVGVAGYNLYRNGSKVWSGSNTGYTDSSVSPSTTYLYSVSAYDTAGNTSPQSGQLSVTTPATQLQILSYSVLDKTDTTATISWTTDQSSTGTVYYGTNQGNLSSQVPDTTSGTSHTVSLTGLSSSTKYYYRVDATSGTVLVSSGVSTFRTFSGGHGSGGGGKGSNKSSTH